MQRVDRIYPWAGLVCSSVAAGTKIGKSWAGVLPIGGGVGGLRSCLGYYRPLKLRVSRHPRRLCERFSGLLRDVVVMLFVA